MPYEVGENLCVYVRPGGGIPDAGIADVLRFLPPDQYEVNRDGLEASRNHAESDLFHVDYNVIYASFVRHEVEKYQSFVRKIKWEVINRSGGQNRYRCTIKFRRPNGGRILGMRDIVIS